MVTFRLFGDDEGPRLEFDPTHYPRIRVWCPDEKRDYYLYLHRCTAYAHGIIDDLWESEHIHHLDSDRWNGNPENLEGVDPLEHAEIEPHVANLD